MSKESNKGREERALDALIVGALRRPDTEGEVSLESLPELTEEEKRVLEKRRPGLLERVFAEEVDVEEYSSEEDEGEREEIEI